MSLRAVAPLMLLSGVAIVAIQNRVDAALGSFSARSAPLFSESPEKLRRLVPGFELLFADIYWLRTVQYYGGERAFNPDPHYDHLKPLIAITTSLDPRLELAYRYGAVFLSEDLPIGAGKAREGNEVLVKGVAALPHSWRLRWELGAHWFFFLKDGRRASEVLLQAARLPDAPYWLESLAARFLEGDDRASAREIWRRQYEMGDGSMRENALYNLQVLDALDTKDAYNAALERFRSERGRSPASLRELAEAGYVRDPAPRDPTGTPFHYEAREGRLKLSRNSRLWRSKYE